MRFKYEFNSVMGKHLLHVPKEYKEYCAARRSVNPTMDVLSLAAFAINGVRYARERPVVVRTLFTGRHFIQGELPVLNAHLCWVFDETLACAMETCEVVALTLLPQETIRGWYQCRACGLVMHDPYCPSCSMSCPVCEVMEGERAPNEKEWINSNDHLRLGSVEEFGYTHLSEDDPLDGPLDERDCEDMSELLRRVEAHNFIASCAVFVAEMSRGHLDHLASPLVIQHFDTQHMVGAALWELKACADLHLSASLRCTEKVRTLLTEFTR